jgi:hypothetical protein
VTENFHILYIKQVSNKAVVTAKFGVKYAARSLTDFHDLQNNMGSAQHTTNLLGC